MERRHRTLGTALVLGGAVLVQAAVVAALSSVTAAAAPGNNGTVKISSAEVDSDDSNHPHVMSPFSVKWYGFDAGTRTTSLSFEAQAPSGDGAVPIVLGRAAFTFEASGEGGALNHTEVYELDLTGLTAQDQQGYHVKLTVTTDGSKGNDTKHKVFWLSEPEPTASPTPSETVEPSESPTIEPSVLPTRLVASPTISPSVKGVKIVRTLPRTGKPWVPAAAALGAGLVLVGSALLMSSRGAYAR